MQIEIDSSGRFLKTDLQITSGMCIFLFGLNNTHTIVIILIIIITIEGTSVMGR